MSKKDNDKPELTTVDSEVKGVYQRHRAGFYRPNLLLTLEKRQMYDGAAAALGAEELLDEDANGSEEQLPTPEVETVTPETAEDNGADETSAAGEAAVEDEDEESDVEVGLVDDEADDGTPDFVDDGTPDYIEEDETDSGDEAAVSAVATVANDALDEPEAEEEEEETSAQSSDPEPTEEPEEDQFTANDYDLPDDFDPEDVTEVVFIDTTVAGYEALLDGVLQTEAEEEAQDELEALLGEYEYGETASEEEAASDDEAEEPAAQQDADEEESQYRYINGTLVVLLDSESSQIDQISETLGGYSDLAAVHIISHGATGEVRLGNDRINSANLDDYANTIAQWGDALSASGDILLYGCNVGTDGSGQAFLDQFAEMTEADVAASDDITGAADKGGDWDLEATVGVN